jgi:hypothetical protein
MVVIGVLVVAAPEAAFAGPAKPSIVNIAQAAAFDRHTVPSKAMHSEHVVRQHIDASLANRSVGPIVTQPIVPMQPSASVRSARPSTLSRPVAPKAPAVASSIATTTTLGVNLPNPVVYPAQVHLTATVSPAPQPEQGFIPGILFYDGQAIVATAPLSNAGVGETDLSLKPGSHSLTASFQAFFEYDASTSAPTVVNVVQRPDLAAETGAPSLLASDGFPAERHTQQVVVTSPSMGVGPSDVLTANEDGVQFYDRNGFHRFHLSLPGFFVFENVHAGAAEMGPRSPQLVFDGLHNRWIAVEVTKNSLFSDGHIYIAVTTSSDAVGDWWIYRFDFANSQPRNPSIGVTSDKIVVGYDLGEPNAPQDFGSSLLVVNSADAYSAVSVLNGQASTPVATVHTLRAAVDRTAGASARSVGWSSATDPGHIVEMDATGTVSGPGTGVTFTTLDLTAGPTALPDVGDTVPLGPSSATWASDHLWFASSRRCLLAGDLYDRACVRITELGTSGVPTLEQDFAIGRMGMSATNGGVGIAGDGSAMIVYSLSDPGACPCPAVWSTYATIQKLGDAANTIRPPQLIVPGGPVCLTGANCFGVQFAAVMSQPVVFDPLNPHATWNDSPVTVDGGWLAEGMRLTDDVATAPSGTLHVAGGRPATNSLGIGISLEPDGSSTTSEARVSNSPNTAAGVLTSGRDVPLDWHTPWSLADPTLGGSTATGSRTVYAQFGDGRGNWSSVTSQSVEVDTPLGADFVPVNPNRILDTRTGNGLSGRFKTGVPRSFQVTGRGGVPANATAVTGNLTVTQQTSAGYLFIGPTASSSPTSSTLNFPKGDNRANGVTVKLSGTGKLAVVLKGSAGSTAHALFDVTGYFLADDPTSPTGGTYVPIPPTRVLDTRVPLGLAGKFTSHVPRTFCVTGCVAVPDEATAVTGNLTVTGQTSAGYVQIGPNYNPNPSTSTINFPMGDNRANNVTVPLDSNGNLTAVFVGASSTAKTNLVFDITGYVVKGPWGATFIPLDPSRILDTRTGVGITGPVTSRVPAAFAVAGQGGVPLANTVAVTGNLTLTQQTSGGFAFVGPTAEASPTSSTINVPFGDSRANGLDVGLAIDGSLGIVWVGTASTSTTHAIFDVGGYFR